MTDTESEANWKRGKRCAFQWKEVMEEEMIRSNYTCPDFREYMTKFVEEMMLLTNDGITFYLIQPILSDHGIEDTEGAAYWYLRTYMLHLKPN